MAFEQPATIYLRTDGDLTLVVGEAKQRYVVCRRTITNLCEAWQKMFTNWSEATSPVVEWPEDDPKAILIVLKIAHLKFDELPEEMSLTELHNLATICDKYDLVRAVRPFLGGWVSQELKKAYLSEGNDGFLWAAYVFGYKNEFCVIAKKLQSAFSIDDRARCIGVTGRVLDDERMPPGLLENMVRIREESIGALLKICYDTIDKVEQGNTCQLQHSSIVDECHMLTLGSLVHRLQTLNIWSPRKTSSDIQHSINDFSTALRGSKVHCMPWEPSLGVSHHACNPVTGMVAQASAVLANLPTPVQEHHIRHIDGQARKGLRKNRLDASHNST